MCMTYAKTKTLNTFKYELHSYVTFIDEKAAGQHISVEMSITPTDN